MLDFGLTELFLIVAVAVLAIGPDQMPGLMYRLGAMLRRLRGLRYAMGRHFDDFMEQQDRQNTSNDPQLDGDLSDQDERARGAQTGYEYDPPMSSVTPGYEFDEALADQDPEYITPEQDTPTSSKTYIGKNEEDPT